MLSGVPAAVRAQPAPGAANETSGASLDPGAVAVLPFANISGDPSDDWIGAGIADTISADLGPRWVVSVIAREALSEQGAAAGLPDDAAARQVARRLGVAWTVTGSFQRVGDQIRVVARVADVETGVVRRTVTLDGTGDELFALQDRIVADLEAGFDVGGTDRLAASAASRPATEPRVTTPAPPPLASGSGGSDTGTGSRDDRGDDDPEQIVSDTAGSPTGFVVGGSAGGGSSAAPAERAGAGAGLGILAGRPTVRPTRTASGPIIDGVLDDEVWGSAARITNFVQQSPLDGAPATEDTEVRIAYDAENIYFAFHLHYSNPAIMRANRVDRDQADLDDLVTVYFDTFLDQQRSYAFDVNGYGVQGDGIVGGGGGRSGLPRADRSWDALFETGAQIVEDGYTAEMAIPFKSLRYPRLDPGVDHRWGFQVVRAIKGKSDETDVWAPISRDVTGFMTQMGVLEGMNNLSTARNLEILPTFTAIHFGSLDQATGAFPSDVTPEGGLNLKYGITSNLTADFTFNPDFSQIESDRAQITVNQRFPLFFPELRTFFLEGQEIFRVSSPVNWVNTRTIVDPRYGAKLTGKVGDTTIGLLVANDEAPGKTGDRADPAFGETAQVFIGRARYDLYAESYVGGLVTDRQFMNGFSRAMGVDGQFRIGQTARFNYMAFQTQNRDQAGVETSGPGWGLFLTRSGRNLNLSSFAGSNHPDMDTDVGFIRRVDTQEFWETASYRWWPESWLINWGPRFRYERIYNYDWVLEDEKIDSGLDFSFARNISAGVGVERSLERFGGVDFWKWRYSTNVNVGTSRRLSVGGRFNWGDQISFSATPFLGRGVGAGVNVTLRPVARLQSQINVNTSRLTDVRNGDTEVFDVKIFRALTTYQLSERLVFRNISEFNTFSETVGVNLLFTYRVNAGTVFFFGYDDHYQQREQFDLVDDELFLTRALQRTNRALFTKLQYLFRM